MAFDPRDPAIQWEPSVQAAHNTNADALQAKRTKSTNNEKPFSKQTNDGDVSPDLTMMADPEAAAHQLPVVLETAPKRGTSWGTIMISALGALVSFAAGLAITDLVESLFARADWLGWTALGIAALAGFAFAMICLREFTSLLRLRRIEQLHIDAARAAKDNDAKAAASIVKGLKSLYHDRPDCAWGLAKLGDAEGSVFDADDLLKIAERGLMKELDARASQEIARAVRRVSVVTAVSPIALLDMAFVLIANLSMLRKLAALYGGRPGTIGLFRLARMVIAHLTVTGGVAVGDGLLQQVFGHGIAAKLSARLGSGVLNGLFTARIGLAALAICRPLPFQNLPAPTIKALMSEVAIPTKKD